MASDSKPLTAKEVSQILRVHPVTLYKLVREGKIPSIKIGGEWQFRMDLLESWIAEQTGLRNLRALPARTKPSTRR